MRVSITRADGMVTVDGIAAQIDLSDMHELIHAVQWDNDHGHIEFMPDSGGRAMPNINITDFAPYEYAVHRHVAAVKKAQVERAAKDRQEAEARLLHERRIKDTSALERDAQALVDSEAPALLPPPSRRTRK